MQKKEIRGISILGYELDSLEYEKLINKVGPQVSIYEW
jgi:hypothetical protein